MDKNASPFDFDQYDPGESLAIPIPRRGLFLAALTELKAFNRKADGCAVFKTTDLGLLPEEKFATLKPLVIKGCKISLQDSIVWATPQAAMEPVMLFPADSPALAAFNLFNGKNSIQEISQTLAGQTGWSEGTSHAYTRGLFLKLVVLRVCTPG